MIPRRKLFGSNVRSLRVKKRISQEAFANACGLHRTYIGSVERGERNISIDNMERIAFALDMQLPNLLTVDERQSESGLYRCAGEHTSQR